MKKMSGVICVKCGKEPTAKEARGSMRHPYCKKCFEEDFKSNQDYFNYLEATHPTITDGENYYPKKSSRNLLLSILFIIWIMLNIIFCFNWFVLGVSMFIAVAYLTYNRN